MASYIMNNPSTYDNAGKDTGSNAGGLFGDMITQALGWKTQSQKAQAIEDARKQKQMAAALEMIKASGAQPSVSFGKEGIGLSSHFDTPEKPVTPEVAIKRVVGGYATPEETDLIGKRAGIQQELGGTIVGTNEEGRQESVNVPGQDYGETIRRTMLPQYTRQQVVGDIAGMPMSEGTLPDDYKSKIKEIATLPSESDQKAALQGLLFEYADNPVAVKHLKNVIMTNKKISSGGQKSMRRRMYESAK